MSALPQPQFPVETHRHRSAARCRQKAIGYRQTKRAKSPTASNKRQLPVRLQLLMLLQKGSFGFAALSMAGSIALYLASVRIPQLWSQEYQNLETLQRQERQLTEINETLKYQMARQAELKASKLSTLKPDNAVFVAPAEVEPEPPIGSDREQRKKVAFKYAAPGY